MIAFNLHQLTTSAIPWPALHTDSKQNARQLKEEMCVDKSEERYTQQPEELNKEEGLRVKISPLAPV